MEYTFVSGMLWTNVLSAKTNFEVLGTTVCKVSKYINYKLVDVVYNNNELERDFQISKHHLKFKREIQ